MSLLAAAFTPREVEYPVYRGLGLSLLWRSAVVLPPTTADALAVVHLGEGDTEEPTTRAALLAVARRWLPARCAADLRALTGTGLATALTQMVTQASGVTEADRERASEIVLAARAEGRQLGVEGAASLDAHVLRLALTLGVTPADVLAMPWPVFLASHASLPAAVAEAELMAATAARVSQADREGWSSWAEPRRALMVALGFAPPSENAPSGPAPVRYQDNPAVWEGKGMTREEHEASRASALEAWNAARRARQEAQA